MTRLNADVLTTRVADGIAVITLGSAKRIYFDEEMGDALTEALDQFAGEANVRVIVVTGGAPGLPEANLGLLPCAGGTQRLPRRRSYEEENTTSRSRSIRSVSYD